MREIKFRAWHKQRKWMYQVGYMTFDSKGKISRVAEFNKVHTHEFKEVEIMQFTGLLDKNGKEIFEGDIVRALITNNHSGKLVECYRGVVEMLFGEWTFSTTSLWRLCESKRCEIIGNIYEHRNLLNAQS